MSRLAGRIARACGLEHRTLANRSGFRGQLRRLRRQDRVRHRWMRRRPRGSRDLSDRPGNAARTDSTDRQLRQRDSAKHVHVQAARFDGSLARSGLSRRDGPMCGRGIEAARPPGNACGVRGDSVASVWHSRRGTIAAHVSHTLSRQPAGSAGVPGPGPVPYVPAICAQAHQRKQSDAGSHPDRPRPGVERARPVGVRAAVIL